LVSSDGLSLNVRCEQRRVTMYQEPGRLHRGVAMPKVDTKGDPAAWPLSPPQTPSPPGAPPTSAHFSGALVTPCSRVAPSALSARTLAFSARRTLCCSVIVAQNGGSSSSSGLS
jgi:hypothetical protein